MVDAIANISLILFLYVIYRRVSLKMEQYHNQQSKFIQDTLLVNNLKAPIQRPNLSIVEKKKKSSSYLPSKDIDAKLKGEIVEMFD